MIQHILHVTCFNMLYNTHPPKSQFSAQQPELTRQQANKYIMFPMLVKTEIVMSYNSLLPSYGL